MKIVALLSLHPGGVFLGGSIFMNEGVLASAAAPRRAVSIATHRGGPQK